MEKEQIIRTFEVEIVEWVDENEPSVEATDVQAWLEAGMDTVSTFGEQVQSIRVTAS